MIIHQGVLWRIIFNFRSKFSSNIDEEIIKGFRYRSVARNNNVVDYKLADTSVSFLFSSQNIIY
jgi:hypothetical protein